MTVRFAPTAAEGYYANERADVVAKLPRPLGRVLDVGCGSGAVGRSLRLAGAERLVGVEPYRAAAERAAEVFDEVHVGTIESLMAAGAVSGPFDTIVLYDVLEHLVDPAAVLRELHGLAAPGARVHVSVPNARHFSLLVDLVFRGTFGYRSWGHRDVTHLRWFTGRDIKRLLEQEGWHVTSSSPAILGRAEMVDRLTFRALREFIALQWHVLAERGVDASGHPPQPVASRE